MSGNPSSRKRPSGTLDAKSQTKDIKGGRKPIPASSKSLVTDAVRRRAWRPLLVGETAKRALQAVEGIAAAIQKRAAPRVAGPRTARKRLFRNPSLAGGAAGLAVFYG